MKKGLTYIVLFAAGAIVGWAFGKAISDMYGGGAAIVIVGMIGIVAFFLRGLFQ